MFTLSKVSEMKTRYQNVSQIHFACFLRYTSWPGKILCKIQRFFEAWTNNAAILTIALIVADRFIAVFFPLRGPIVSHKAVQLIIAS